MTRILIINNAEAGISEFTNPLVRIVSSCQAHSTVVNYEYSPSIDYSEYDGIIMSGSPQGDDIVEHHAPFFSWIKSCEVPVFGICAGHHITGFLYGSEILKSIEPESGDVKIQILKEDPLLNYPVDHFLARQMHNDSITLPEHFDLLATSSICKVQLMKHKQKPIYTSQFHPEINNPEIIKNFVALCGFTK